MKNSLRDLFNGFQFPSRSMKSFSQRIISFTGLLRVYMVLMLVTMVFVVLVTKVLMVVSVCIVSIVVPPSPAQSRPCLDPPTLRATQSFKLCLQLVLHQNRKNTQQSKHHQEEDGLHSDRVHGGGQLLKSCTSLNEDK